MLKQWLCAILVAGSLTAMAQEQAGSVLPSLDEVAGRCQASIIETPNLKLKEAIPDMGREPYCSIRFKSKEHVTGESISVLFYPRKMDMDDKYGMGFLRIPDKPGQWHFVGTGDVLLESRILKRHFTHENNGDEELLVGHQLLRGKMPNGGVTELPGIRILRLTPQFAISVELDYEPMTSELSVKAYEQRLDMFNRELVEIVRSLRPTPGNPGPTVRQP